MVDLTPVNFLDGLGGLANLSRPYDDQQQVLQDQATQDNNRAIVDQRRAATDAINAKLAQQQAYSDDVRTALAAPTPQNFAALIAKYPEQHDALKQAWDAQDEPTKRTNLQQLGGVFSFLSNGKADLAAKTLQSRIDAEKKAGLDTSDDEQILELISSGKPEDLAAAKGIAGYHLAAVLGPEKFGESLKTLGIDNGGDGSTVINAGGALVNKRTGEVLYQADSAQKYMTVKNGDGSESIVEVGGGKAGGGGQASGGGAPSGSGGAPLSVRLNNPGAIRFDAANDWVGQVGSEKGFVKFDTPENGQRAHRKIIANQIKNGFDTPLSWAQHYAPSSDGNDPQAYAARVAAGLGIGINDKIPIGAVPKMAAISASVESGGTPAPSGGAPASEQGAKILYTSKPGSDDQPDPASVEYYAQDLANGGTMPTLGSGKTAAKWRQAILKRKAEIQTGKGLDGADNTLRESDVKAARMALGQLMKTQSNVRGFESTFTRNADEALRTAPKGVAGSAPVFNRWIQAGRKSIQGDPDVSAFNVAINTAANEYAKLASGASGGAVTSDSARHEAMEILNNAQTLPQLQASIRQMKIDGHNRILGMNEQEARLRSVILGKATGTADAPKPDGAAPTQTATNPKTGQKLGLVNGKWVPIK